MKTKFFIFAFLIGIITVTVIVSCQKSETPTGVMSSSPAISSGSTQQSNRRTHEPADDICGTFYLVPLGCDNNPTDCLCEVVIYSGAGWPSRMADSIAQGSSGVANFFSNTTCVENTFPVLLDKTQSGNQDSILCSGNYYITGASNTAGHHYLQVKENGTGTLAFVLTFTVE